MSAKERVSPPSSSREANTGLAAQVAGGHLAHAVGQQQQRAHQLVAQQRRPAAPRRRPTAPAPASACRCTCGAGRRAPARAAGIRCRPSAPPARWPPAARGTGCTTSRKRSSPGLSEISLRGTRASARTRGPWCDARPPAAPRPGLRSRWPRRRARAWRSSRGAGALGRHGVGAAAGAEQHLPVGASSARSRSVRAARAAAPAPAASPAARSSPSRSAASRVLAAQVGDQRFQRALAQRQAGVQRGGHLHVEPDLDAARHELVGHGVDHQPRQQPHQREDAGQLGEQPACRTCRAAGAAPAAPAPRR